MNTLERHGVFEVLIWYLAWGMCSGVRGARLMGEGDLSTSLPCSRPRYFLLFPFFFLFPAMRDALFLFLCIIIQLHLWALTVWIFI